MNSEPRRSVPEPQARGYKASCKTYYLPLLIPPLLLTFGYFVLNFGNRRN